MVHPIFAKVNLKNPQIIFSGLCFLLFLMHQFTEPFFKHWLIDGYLDDFCFLPVAFGFSTVIISNTVSANFRFTKKMAFVGFLLTVVSTELIFPVLSKKHTADMFDTLAYAAGGLIFLAFGNKSTVN